MTPSFAQAAHELVTIRTGKVEDAAHVDEIVHQARLFDVAWDAVEHEKIEVRLEAVRIDLAVDEFLPELDRQLVGHQFTAAGIGKEGLAQFSASIQ